MALAEARAVWQRTANRCLVQEDAKRAPKFACGSSVSPSVKRADPAATSAALGREIPKTGSLPFNLNPSYFNSSPTSKWWLQMSPNYGYQKDLMEDQFNSLQGQMETYQIYECLATLAGNEDGCGFIDQTTSMQSSGDNQCQNFTIGDKKDFGEKVEELREFSSQDFQNPFKYAVRDNNVGEQKVERLVGFAVSKKANELNLDLGSSWIGAEKNTPWWRTADTDELALLVAQKSLDHVENCDLPRPQKSHFDKDVEVNIFCFCHSGTSGSLLDPKLGTVNHHHFSPHKPGCLSVGSTCQLMSGTEKPLRLPEMDMFEKNECLAQLLEALRHSQTRAREAEGAAKQAGTEKEQVIKLVIRQASQLFAYKLWLQLLQLENMYLQFKNNKIRSVSIVLPITLPWMPRGTREMHKSRLKFSRRKQAKRPCPNCDSSKYAVVFAVGLGLVGAGFLLGWTVGWMLPTW